MLQVAVGLIKKSFVEKGLLSDSEFERIASVKEQAVATVADNICKASFCRKDKKLFNEFFTRIGDNEGAFYRNLIGRALIEIYPGGECPVISSFVRGRFVFLGFLFKGKRYYLVQHLNVPAGLVSVDDFGYMKLNRVNIEPSQAVKDLLEAWLANPNKSVAYEQAANRVSGVVLNTDRRPSHLFYEMLPALFGPAFKPFKDDMLYSFYRKGADFIDSSTIFDGDIKEVVASDVTIQDFIIENKVIAIQPGFREFRGFYDCIDSCDTFLVEKFSTSELNGLFPVVWFSVLSEEKTWIEQNSTIASIIKKFLDEYECPAFLFDGLTCPVSVQSSEGGVRRDVLDIKDKVGEDFFYIDMDGLKSGEKIGLAAESDIFLASMGTDSLYPSRIAKKPGVVHCSPDVSMFKKHRYSEFTFSIPPEKARFLEGQQHLRADKRSYSIDQGVVENAFWEVWEKCKNEI